MSSEVLSRDPDLIRRDEDGSVREDVRLLGRLLGEAVRGREGDTVFDAVERVRQASVRFHRDADPSAGREVAEALDAFPLETVISLVRAFTYFLHLANIAEDRDQTRRGQDDAALGSSLPREGTLAHALDRLEAAGLDADNLAAFLETALVSPVLTAHPTEVQRKSILSLERNIAALLDARERGRLTPEEAEENDAALERVVPTLWYTGMLRRHRLAVIDEVKNGISHYESTFFAELPRLYCRFEDLLARRYPGRAWRLPPFFRIGAWIGGDRDGNPFVTAPILRETIRLQSAAALEHYLSEIHELGGELSVSKLLMDISPELAALAERSPDNSRHREDEPFRRALTGIYARLAATAEILVRHEALRDAVGDAAPYIGSDDLLADLEVLAASLKAHGAGRLAGGRLRRLIVAVRVFGFHLAS
ncbi:MAG: phosphoenolpyruvate carboxylase, partial [Myxococcales bacterium]|nr:phosphoenolpyruvate carboxylase [Myxococcales bacterium]